MKSVNTSNCSAGLAFSKGLEEILPKLDGASNGPAAGAIQFRQAFCRRLSSDEHDYKPRRAGNSEDICHLNSVFSAFDRPFNPCYYRKDLLLLSRPQLFTVLHCN